MAIAIQVHRPAPTALQKSLTAGTAMLSLVEQIAPDVDPVVDALCKGKTHKYVMRQLSGKPAPAPKYRYWYRLPDKTLVTSDRLEAGAKFRGSHEGQEGHFEVLGHDRSTGYVTIRHSGSGKTDTLHHEQFAQLVNAQHEAASQGTIVARRQEIMEAIKVLNEGGGGPGQAQRARRLVTAAERWLSPPEVAHYRHAIDAAAAKLATEAKDPARQLQRALSAVPTGHREVLERHLASAAADAGAHGKVDGRLGIAGDTDTMRVADVSGQGALQPITWRIVDVDELVPSHLPRDRFRKNPNYPAGVQERNYDRDENYQAQVVKHAKNLGADFLINTNPDAANGAPIVTPDGVVLGGNSRTMTMDLVYSQFPESATKYKELLAKKARQFGLSPADVQGMKRPVLVREVADPGTKEGRVDLVRRYNETFTQSMDPREEQIALAKRIGPTVLSKLAALGKTEAGEDVDETFDAFLKTRRSEGLVNAMLGEGIIDARNRARFITPMKAKVGGGLLNEMGRLLVSQLLVGKVVNNIDDLEDLGLEFRGNLAAQLPVILAAGQSNPAFDLTKAVQLSAAAMAEMRRKGEPDPLTSVADTEITRRNAETGAEEVQAGKDIVHPIMRDPLAQAVFATLTAKSQRSAGPKFRKYASLAAQPSSVGGMFGDGPSDEQRALDAMRYSFGFHTDHPLREMQAEREEQAKAKQEEIEAEKRAETRRRMKERGVAAGGVTDKPRRKKAAAAVAEEVA